MIYRCDQCGTVLGAGMTTCPRCGKTYDHPVPADAEAGAPTPMAMSTAPVINRTPSSNQGVLTVVLGLLGVFVFLGLLVWGGYTVWMHGSGGTFAFNMHNQAGNDAFGRGDFQTANREYSEMIALRPQRVDGYTLRGICETKAGQYADAITDDTRAIDLSSDPYDKGLMLYNRAEARDDMGRFKPALADYLESSRELRLTDKPAYKAQVPGLIAENMRGMVWTYLQQKDYSHAISSSSELISSNFTRPADYQMRSRAEAALGQIPAQEKDLAHMIALDPTNASGYEVLADVEDKHGQDAQAVALLQRGTEAMPGNAALWGSLGWFQYKAGQNAQAIATDRHAQALDPNQGWVNINLGLAYAVAGDQDKAVSAYASALTHLAPKDREAAISDLHDALAKKPGSALLHLALQQVTTGRVPSGISVHALLPASLPAPSEPSVPSAFARAIGPESVQDGYGIRPPKGYQESQGTDDTTTSQGVVYLWEGPANSNNIKPDMQVTILHDDGEMAAQSTSSAVLADYMTDFTSNHTKYSQSPITTCKVNGLPFARCDWSGVGTHTGLPFKGFVYISVTPNHYVRIECHDSEPSERATLPLLRASTLTFRAH